MIDGAEWDWTRAGSVPVRHVGHGPERMLPVWPGEGGKLPERIRQPERIETPADGESPRMARTAGGWVWYRLAEGPVYVAEQAG